MPDTEAHASPAALRERIEGLAAEHLEAVDAVIEARLQSEVPAINHVSHYIVNAGGKRLRPLLVVLSARAFGERTARCNEVAAVVELIHTATLLHDDVVDGSELRRGRATANARFGNGTSVLVGDFLYSRAIQIAVQIASMPIMKIMADSTNVITEGEVLQLFNCNDPDTTEERYLRVIRAKTAKLFEAAARAGAVIAEASSLAEEAMARFGHHLGIAYQLVDDVLDYRGSADEIGKNVGDDLAEGKPTLPLIHAMRRGSPSQIALLREAILNGRRDDIDDVVHAVESTGGIIYTARAAEAEASQARQALSSIPSSCYREALETLVEFSINRNY